MWNFVTPQLAVPNVAEAQRYYHEVLDFTIGFSFGENFGAVLCGTTEIFLNRSDAPSGQTWNCVRVDDADRLLAIYRERGAKIVADIEDKPWGMREFTLSDPWGHHFRIGHSTRT